MAGGLLRAGKTGPRRPPRWEPGPGTPLAARAPPARGRQGLHQGGVRRREPSARSLPTCLGREGAGSGALRPGCPRPHMSVGWEAWRLAPAPAGPVL